MITGILTFIFLLLTAVVFVGLLAMPVYLVIAFCRALWRDGHSDFSPNRRTSMSA